ncbi:WD40 repeat protein [Chitinophaga niastensis]|uniref:WD40 repeat protein n=1 Tax=Chitinophaga niastensis TaxID=536980 RepID=A0A2P8HGN5_CHINA|nr:PD40 domain-containing protein [Chitinophaga niastensis]PSL45378.1 WD40 repeat protein [Chitinophaga niastensis]
MNKFKIIPALFIIISCTHQTANKSPVFAKVPTLFAEGIISTGDYETHPAFSPSGDTVYFLKCTPDMNACTICVSYHSNDTWSAPEIVSFSGRYVDVDPFVTKDGNTLYFVSDRPVHEGDSAKADWDIWKTDRTASGWGAPVHLDTIINSSASEFYPTVADNGTLYFGSGRAGGKGASDIYSSKFINGKYTTPENLGDSINTADNEYEPFIAPDESYLIYMATIPKGIIHGDLYISHRHNGSWSKAKKLNIPVNSTATEWSPKVTRDGKYFFFGSTRNKVNGALPQRTDIQPFERRIKSAGNGLGDIYYIDFSLIRNQ